MSEFISRISKLVGSEQAIYKIVRVPILAEMPSLYWYVAHFSRPEDYQNRNQTSGHVSSGVSFSKTQALAAALGEAVERFAASTVDQGRLCFSREQALSNIAFSFDILPQGTEQEYAASFSLTMHQHEDAVHWIDAQNIITNHFAYLPATMAYLTYPSDREADRFWHLSSTGLACHDTRERAIQGGVLEVIERDALATSWFSGKIFQRLPVSILSDEVAMVVHCLEKQGLSIYIGDATSDLAIPCVVVAILDFHGEPAAVVGADAAFDFRTAAEKALFEALKKYRIVDSQLKNGETVTRPLQNFRDHTLYYAFQPNSKLIRERFSDQVTNIDQLGDRVSTWNGALQHFASQKIDVWWVDLTPPTLATSNIHVGRAILPHLLPLSPSETFLYRRSTRFESVSLTNLLPPHPYG